jgi:hypothetical protein
MRTTSGVSAHYNQEEQYYFKNWIRKETSSA